MDRTSGRRRLTAVTAAVAAGAAAVAALVGFTRPAPVHVKPVDDGSTRQRETAVPDRGQPGPGGFVPRGGGGPPDAGSSGS